MSDNPIEGLNQAWSGVDTAGIPQSDADGKAAQREMITAAVGKAMDTVAGLKLISTEVASIDDLSGDVCNQMVAEAGEA
jgi:hypothetical protein